MRRQIKKHLRDFLAIIVLVVLAVVVGGYILSQQRLNLPGWVPFVGQDFYTVNAEFTSAQAVQAGQGQAVRVAGVKVGNVAGVKLVDGKAVVTMQIDKQYAPLYRDAQLLLRPITQLNDMYVELDVGTPRAGKLASGATLSSANTKPQVNLGEFLSVLDADTRNYLVLLINGASRGVENNSSNLNAAIKEFDPISRNTKLIFTEIATRRDNLRSLVHNMALLTNTVGAHDQQLGQLIDSSNTVFKSFANQQQALRESVRELAPTLTTATKSLRSTRRLTHDLGPAFQELVPGARALKGSLNDLGNFAKQTEPVVANQLRPLARQAQPALNALQPVARNLAKATPALTKGFENLNVLLDLLGYNPKGSEDGYLFWLGWANNSLASVLSLQDAQGPILRGLAMLRCAPDVALVRALAKRPDLPTAALLFNSLDLPPC